MRHGTGARWMILAVVLAFGCWAGCRNGSAPDEPPPSGAPGEAQAVPGEGEGSDVDTTPAEEPPPPPTIPEVHLLDADRETCLVGVDDPMPEAELVDLDGEKQALGELRGEKLTVVLFWTSGDSEFSAMRAQAALEDLQKDVHEPYAEKGVRVVAVNEGDTAESVKKLVEEAALTFPNLMDSDGALFAKVATEKLPRPYLLDAEGKILWFDLDFSPTTRDNLMQAIQVALGETAETETAGEPDSPAVP